MREERRTPRRAALRAVRALPAAAAGPPPLRGVLRLTCPLAEPPKSKAPAGSRGKGRNMANVVSAGDILLQKFPHMLCVVDHQQHGIVVQCINHTVFRQFAGAVNIIIGKMGGAAGAYRYQ